MKPWESAALRAVLPQQTALSFPFTVREIVRLGMLDGRSGVLAGEAERLPDRALARVDLDGFAGRFYQELSGGEQQRVQLARVLCQVWAPVLEGAPRYLFLDEPVSSLDIKHQLIIMDIARDFARRGGGVVAILHDLNLTAMYRRPRACDASRAACRRRLAAGGAERRSHRSGVRMPAEGRRAAGRQCAVRAAAVGAGLRGRRHPRRIFPMALSHPIFDGQRLGYDVIPARPTPPPSIGKVLFVRGHSIANRLSEHQA